MAYRYWLRGWYRDAVLIKVRVWGSARRTSTQEKGRESLFLHVCTLFSGDDSVTNAFSFLISLGATEALWPTSRIPSHHTHRARAPPRHRRVRPCHVRFLCLPETASGLCPLDSASHHAIPAPVPAVG